MNLYYNIKKSYPHKKKIILAVARCLQDVQRKKLSDLRITSRLNNPLHF